MSEYRNELLEGWVGKPVVLSMQVPPDWADEQEEIAANVDRMAEDPCTREFRCFAPSVVRTNW